MRKAAISAKTADGANATNRRRENAAGKVQKVLKEKKFPYKYAEEDGCGSINFEYRGVVYHIWEFQDNGQWGAETNVRIVGRHEDILGDYEEEIIKLISGWN